MQIFRLSTAIIIGLSLVITGCSFMTPSPWPDDEKVRFHTTRSATSDSGLQLTFKLPDRIFFTGRNYVVETILIDDGGKHHLVGSTNPVQDVFEIVLLDNKKKPSLVDGCITIIGMRSSHGSSPGGDRADIKTLVRFTKPGMYLISCRISDAGIKRITTKKMKESLRRLKTEPVVVLVR